MNELYHHGVKGQKLGVRRYQNPDGSLTSAGQKRLSKSIIKDYKKPTMLQLTELVIKIDKYLIYEKVS